MNSDQSGPSQPDQPALPPASSPDRLSQFRSGSARRATYSGGYSQRVRRLRVVLPAVALVTLGVVLLWPRIRAEFHHPTTTSAEERQAKMVKGRYVGSDSHGRPYTITYDSARQASGGGPITMINPLAELTLQNGHWVVVKADEARYDQTAATIDLRGHVELLHDEGYQFASERARVEFNKNLIWTDRAVTGQGPKGEIVARGLREVNNGDTIVFTGPARMILRPDAAQMDEPE
jgi:lipopolysaccharide export system protein LptC